MTACIVGWAHTPFGRHDGEDVESLIGKVAGAAIADAGVHPRPTSTRSFSAISMPASRARISRPRWSCSICRNCASSARRASRTPAPPARRRSMPASRAIAAKQARLVLVVGVEKMTDAAGPDVGRNLLKASYVREEAEIGRRLRRHLRPDRPALLPAAWRPVGRARADRRQEPRERRRQSARADPQGPRLRLLPQPSEKNPIVAPPLAAHRLQPGVRWRRRRGAGRHRHGAGPGQGDRVPRRRAGERLPAHEPPRSHEVRGLLQWPGSGRWKRRGWDSTI